MREREEILKDIMVVKRQIASLPDSAMRQGMGDDYLDHLASLEEELLQLGT